jgi:enoyl-CoA hydratase
MQVELADGVTIVRIDHPPVNAFDLGLVDDAVATIRGITGPIVITGTGKCFSAGVDLRAFIEGGADDNDRFLAALSGAFLTVFDHPAPVVAAINGGTPSRAGACWRWPPTSD